MGRSVKVWTVIDAIIERRPTQGGARRKKAGEGERKI